MQLSITVEGLFGLNWDRWKQLSTIIEQAGFHGQYCSDHFLYSNPPDVDSLEVFTALTYLADHSQHVQIGTMVSPLSFRDPLMLARQAMAINDLCAGRMILGIGTGWMEREHTIYGYQLGTIKERMDRLEEGVQIIHQLTRQTDPLTFTGQYYQLQSARLLPQSQYPLRILIGGNGKKRTLPLVAKYADVWNAQWLSLDDLRERNDYLNDLLEKEGRRPQDVKRTCIRVLWCWRDDAEREHTAEAYRRVSNVVPTLPTDELVQLFRENLNAICGTPDEVIEQLKSFEEAGIEEVIWQYITLDTPELLEIVADSLLPHLH